MNRCDLVNLNKEYFDASIYLDMIWKDRRLKWDRDKYNGIHSIRVSTAEVWKPDLEVMNRVHDFPLVDEKMPRIRDSQTDFTSDFKPFLFPTKRIFVRRNFGPPGYPNPRFPGQ